MDAKGFNIEQLLGMAHSPVRNYAIPGLTSWLVGQPSSQGTMRLFDCCRMHQEAITPHSHRFNFQAWVLEGYVVNRVWREAAADKGDPYAMTVLNYGGECGKYELGDMKFKRYEPIDATYRPGQCYSMRAEEIHSIFFGRGTRVLFFEGPTVSDSSVILEPYVDGEHIPTFKVEPWMFKRPEVDPI